MTRQQALEPVIGDRRRVGAEREQAAFEEFCRAHGVPTGPDAVALYLTHLLERGAVHGRGLRYRLHLLDLHARLAGLDPPSNDHGLRRYLRGLHRKAALATPESPVAPVHREVLYALLDAIEHPEPGQLRDRALVLVAAATSLPNQVIEAMQWHEVRIFNDSVQISVPPMPGRGPRPYSPLTIEEKRGHPSVREALIAWRASARSTTGPVWAWERQEYDIGSLRPTLRRLGPRPSPADIGSWRCSSRSARQLVKDVLAPAPAQVRDRALLLIAWTAALGTGETRDLLQKDVRVVERGLLLRIPGRREHWTAVPRVRGGAPCPREAWQAWRRLLRQRGLLRPDSPAFGQVSGQVVRAKPLGDPGLNAIVHQASEKAGLRGDFAFTSLRSGFIRTALRAGVPEHVIARQASLDALHSVATHARREHLLSKNVARLVGL